MRKPIFLLACMAFLFTLACKPSTTTRISQSFRNPGFENTVFTKLFVLGVAPTQEGRIAFEDGFVAAIEKEGGKAQASWTILPESTRLPDDAIYGAVQHGSFDGVLVTRVLSVDKSTTFTPPKRYNRPRTTHYRAGPAWGMGFGGYMGFYGTTFTEVHRPGYLETTKTIRLETNLYSVATNDLVWTGQSETVDPKSMPSLIASMTASVARKLKKEKLIP
ncbi:MAG TPA: hypothetical protein VLS88_14155 [Polyangiales bacterium]|nr:hypothetical protein [Polyangiales bacterium]